VTDRRRQPRYDVIGALWGVLELCDEARLRNVSATGVLLDSPVPMALDSTQTFELAVEGQGVSVDARVRHVTLDRGNRLEPRYVVGLEFVDPPVPVVQSIEQLGGSAD
jgi:hypothetical protein